MFLLLNAVVDYKATTVDNNKVASYKFTDLKCDHYPLSKFDWEPK